MSNPFLPTLRGDGRREDEGLNRMVAHHTHLPNDITDHEDDGGQPGLALRRGEAVRQVAAEPLQLPPKGSRRAEL